MAAWSSALDFGAHPAVGYYYEGHTVGVKVVVVELVASARLFKSHIIIVVGNTNVGGDKSETEMPMRRASLKQGARCVFTLTKALIRRQTSD